MGLAAPHRQARRRSRVQRVPARLHHLLAAIEIPAFVEGTYFDVLASNALARALSPRLRPGQNRLRSLLPDDHLHGPAHLDFDEGVELFASRLGNLLPSGASVAIDEWTHALRRAGALAGTREAPVGGGRVSEEPDAAPVADPGPDA